MSCEMMIKPFTVTKIAQKLKEFHLDQRTLVTKEEKNIILNWHGKQSLVKSRFCVFSD